MVPALPVQEVRSGEQTPSSNPGISILPFILLVIGLVCAFFAVFSYKKARK
jgi:hypothetical protein